MMRRLVYGLLLVFAVTLAWVIGSRMSTEAMAVLVGVVVGVVAGIPMSLLIMMALNRPRPSEREDPFPNVPQSNRHGSYPPVVVIQGGLAQPGNALNPYYPVHAPDLQTPTRSFRLVGDSQN